MGGAVSGLQAWLGPWELRSVFTHTDRASASLPQEGRARPGCFARAEGQSREVGAFWSLDPRWGWEAPAGEAGEGAGHGSDREPAGLAPQGSSRGPRSRLAWGRGRVVSTGFHLQI